MIHLFKTFLPIAEKIYNRKTTMDILHHICIRDGFMNMTDLEIFVRMPIGGKQNYTLPIKMLKKILSTKPSTLDIQLLEKEKVRITFDDKSITIPTMNADEYPSLPNEKFTKVAEWKRQILLKLAKQTSFASNDILRPALTGIFVEQNSTLSSVATNGQILQWHKNLGQGSTLLQDCQINIPARLIKMISKFAGPQVEVLLSDKYLGFRLPNGIELYGRPIEDPYVDFQRVIPLELPNQITLSKQKLLAEIKSAKPFTEKISLHALNGSIEFKTEDFDENLQYTSSMDVEKREGQELDVCLNLDLLERTVNAMDAEFISWKYINADSPNILTSDENVLQLLMPIRRKDQ